MSQTAMKSIPQQPHKILIKNKNPGTISTGANTVIEIDGKPLKHCIFFKMEVKPGKLAKITIEVLADVEIEGYVLGSPFKEKVDLDSDIVKDVSNSAD